MHLNSWNSWRAEPETALKSGLSLSEGASMTSSWYADGVCGAIEGRDKRHGKKRCK